VKIITGTFSSRLCGAASEAAARQNVILLGDVVRGSALQQARPEERVPHGDRRHRLRLVQTSSFIAKHLAPRFGKKPNELKIAFLSEDSSYGQGVTESARARAKDEFKMQEVAAEYYNFQTINDFTPIIVKFKQLAPDIVHHIGYTNDAPLFWRQAREQNFLFKAHVHAGATGYGSVDFGKALGNDANGAFALLEPGPGFRLESLKPEGQKIEKGIPRRRAEAHRLLPRSAAISSSRAWRACGCSRSCSTRPRPTIRRSSATPCCRSTCRWGR